MNLFSLFRRRSYDLQVDGITNRRSVKATKSYPMDVEQTQSEIDQVTTSESNKATNQSFCEMLKARTLYILIALFAIIVTITCITFILMYEQDTDPVEVIDALHEPLPEQQSFWFENGLDELKVALSVRLNMHRAKNVILFVGDGMGVNTVTATRIYKYGESGRLSWEEFPHVGMLKTYCSDKQVTDSAAAATALFGGVKTNYEVSGVDSGVHLADCQSSLNSSHHVHSILKWAQDEDMSTGFVTTTRVVHATPSALYAHVADRRWECEAKMKSITNKRGCKDIARQLIEDMPGRDFNVIMGGGRQCLVSNVTGTPADPIDTWSCYSSDGRDLMNDWRLDKSKRKKKHAIVENTEQLHKVNAENADYLLGIFANGHLKYEDQRDKGPKGMPSLAEMTETALNVLRKNPKGFVLVVEGGLIDQAHHRGWARRALAEASAMDDAVRKTVELMKDKSEETLIVVAADHSHTLSINGYPSVGNNILGIAQKSKIDRIPYTALTYGTGGPASFQMIVDDSGSVHRRDPSVDDTQAFDYVQQAAILTDENTHGGADVSIHAIGPMAHLFHRVHEQTFVAHVISYAARIGRFRENQLVQDWLDLFGR